MVLFSLHQGSNKKQVYHFTNTTYTIFLSCKPILNDNVTNTIRLNISVINHKLTQRIYIKYFTKTKHNINYYINKLSME